MARATSRVAGGATRAGAGRRLEGLDLARALAFTGMVFAHYLASSRAEDPGWLQGLDAAADGRAAPLFATLLGVGAGLLLARGTSDAVLLRRGLVLGGLGLAIWPYVERVYLILPHYGLLLALVPLARRLADRWLLVTAAVAFTLPSLAAAVLDDDRLRSGAQPRTYDDLRDVGRVVRHLLWTGGYPLVGWAGFVAVGLWVARRRLAAPAVQWRLLLGGAAVAATQPLWAAALERAGGRPVPGRAEGWAAFLDSTAHANRTAWYVVAAGSAVAVIAACLLLTRTRRRWLGPLVVLGQMALSAYLAHLAVGAHWVWPWRDRELPALEVQVAVALGVIAALAVAAVLWRTRFRRGPVEALARALSG